MSDEGLTNPWPEVDAPAELEAPEPQLRGGPEFAELHRAQRLLQDRLSGAALPSELSQEVTDRLLELAELLADHQVREHDRRDGWRPDLPGRAHPLLPAYVVDGEDGASLHGRVTFTRFYLGGNNVAHGGTQPLLFDDVLGRVMNHGQAGVARTAYLTVNYRAVTPLDVELFWDATRDRIDGRKRWGSARLTDASGQVLSDAEGLFVQLLPGQP
jgi:hypothetical protein